ncbi:hypothetical protein MNBD_UNCLBAC01-1762 [hydrothermal vent metagenome]|uniref:Uncharacterized protein n=1 Tax=hydrothermal vent metagenome TaxID=652676 RepID=A0A3B1D8Y7_9ZZZZ
MRFYLVFLALLAGGFCGCQKSPALSSTNSKSVDIEIMDEEVKNGEIEIISFNSFSPFYVFADKGSRKNHYIPSGFMPDGKCVSFKDTWTNDCHSGNTCLRIVYDVGCSRATQKWAGIYWLNPANNWGQRKGGFDLTGATKLTFWAKGEKGGEQIQEFTVGGISGNYPDSDTAYIGSVILSSEWRKYTIDLRGKDLSYISGGFSWTTNEEVNPESCVFFLDEIRFE